MSITLLYLHDIPVDSLSIKLFDGGTLVDTVSMTGVEDGDRACLWTGTLAEEPASPKLEWEAFENGGSQKVAWGDAIGFVDGATVRLDEDNSITSLDGAAITDAIGVVDGIVDAIKAQTDKLDFGGTGSVLKAESTNMRGTDNAVTSLDGVATADSVSWVSSQISGLSIPTASDVASAVWGASTRTLTSFGTLVADIVSGIWSATTRKLTEFTFKPEIDATQYAALAKAAALPANFDKLKINTEGNLTVEAEAVVNEESIRNAMGLEEGKRVATPEDVSANIIVAPNSAVSEDRGSGFKKRRYVGEISPVTVYEVEDSLGNPIDLSSINEMVLVIQDCRGSDVQVVTGNNITVSGSQSNAFAWTPNEASVSKERTLDCALWEYRDGKEYQVIITGTLSVEVCPRED